VPVLALGLGCVVGIFDVAHGALDAPLPCAHPERVVVAGNANTRDLLFSYDLPNPRLGTIFERAAEYKLLDANLNSAWGPRRIQIAMVTSEFFPMLGTRISPGHGFSAAEFSPGSFSPWLPIILSHDLWRSYFSSNEAILDHSIELNIPPYHFQVIGIAEAGTNFPPGVDAWVPVHLTSFSTIQTADVPAGSGGAIGLLKPGISMVAAEAAIRTWPSERFFDSGAEGIVKLVSLREFQAGEVYPLSRRLWVVSIFFLLLIIIAAGIVFQTEAEARREELAIRAALGASPGRLFGSLCVEIGLVVSIALAGSFLVRSVLIRAAAFCLSLPKGFDARIHGIDIAMMGGAAACACLWSLAVQSVQLRHSRGSSTISTLLRCDSVKGSAGTGRGFRYRLPAQIIPATMILILAALLCRSAYKTMCVDPGVQTAGTFVSEVSFFSDFDSFLASRVKPQSSEAERDKAYEESSRQFCQLTNLNVSRVVSELAKSAGVVQVGAISTAPYRHHPPLAWDVRVSPDPGISLNTVTIRGVIFRSITPGAIAALGMRLLRGRNLDESNAEGSDSVIVNEAFAKQAGGGPGALGMHVKVSTFPTARIVGIVNNVREMDLYSQVWPTVYFPFSHHAVPDVDLVIRTAPGVSAREAARLVRTTVRSMFPQATVSHFEQLDEMVKSAAILTRYTAYYLLALAIVSVLLAGFCASSKTLAEFHLRKREIGIRMAIGAEKGDIIKLFVYFDLAWNLIAAVLGGLLAWWLSSFLGYLLYDVKISDPLSYVIGVTTLIGYVVVTQVLLLNRALQKNPRDLM